MLLFVFAAMFFCVSCSVIEPEKGKAKYVFLFIGDGMGENQRMLAKYYSGNIPLTMNSLPVSGKTFTTSLGGKTTDSAAAGTAIACGRKTRNGIICMGQYKKQKLKTIAELAKEHGMKVGIISSVSIDHATPACFYSHQPSRKKYYEIAMELPKSNFDFFGGGQMKGGTPKYVRKRKSPADTARESGYKLAGTKAELMNLKPGAGKVWAFGSLVDSDAALPYEMDRPENQPSLAGFTGKAIELLDNPKGFFLMVEGGKIDWACHSNDAAAAVKDIVAFDQAIAQAMKFYRKHPKQTLIVVTADHETGKLDIDKIKRDKLKKLADSKTSYLEFQKTIEKFRKGKTHFNEALPALMHTFNLDKLSKSELAQVREAYAQSMVEKKYRNIDKKYKNRYGTYIEPVVITCTRLRDRQAGIKWNSLNHTSRAVMTSAIGVDADLFKGEYENTQICHKLREAMGFPALK